MLKIKRIVRGLIVKALWATDEWVIPSKVYDYMDAQCFNGADNIIEQQAKLYPHDPEITKARTMLSFEARMASEDVD